MLTYSLNKQIDSQKLLSDIQELINKSIIGNNNYIMKIQIVPIAYEDTGLIPKLEVKYDSP